MEKTAPTLASLKNTTKQNIKSQYGISKNTNHIWIVAINNQEYRDFVLKWLSDIWLWAIVLWSDEDLSLSNIVWLKKLNPNMLVGFDFFIYDNDFEGVEVVAYMWAWIVPIMPLENTFSWILKPFDPMKFEWNWFFWKGESPYLIFEKVVSYLENIKFPEDKRVLIKNVTSTF